MKQKTKEVNMRLDILNNGYKLGTKILFSIIRIFSGYPLPDAARIIFYRPDFYGENAKRFTQQAMRGPSSWSVSDREVMAAYVSKINACNFCIKAHSAVSANVYKDKAKVEKIIADPSTAEISPQLRATLLMLGKLTREQAVTAEDIHAMLQTGVTRQQVEDALAVNFAFNVTNRLADTFDFFIPPDDAFDAGAKYLLKRGYA